MRRRDLLGAAALGALPGMLSATPLDKVKARGALVVGLYKEMPPFNAGGAGIDVELGRALAEALGLKFSPLPFSAGENMDDDLRNMVWRGHYLGFGPADVLLHVPVDRPLMQANPQVAIKTSMGEMVVELYPDKAPRSVENFLPVRSSHSVRISQNVGTPQVSVTRSPSSSS